MTALTERPAATDIPVVEQTGRSIAFARTMAVLRIMMGWTFLWPFMDKTFGLGFATERADAWINGGSPTTGYLTFATSGPFAGFFQSFAGQTWADWLFMIGLLGIGLALITGVGLRIAAATGATLLVLMALSQLPFANNPIIDGHIIEALLLVVLALGAAGDTWGLGRRWAMTPLVVRYPVLR